SSGKMGFALAEASAERGANVILVSGPTNLHPVHENIKIERITSAREMLEVTSKYFDEANIFIASAAVADYAPKDVASEKIKKNDDSLTIELVKNPDILKTLGEQKSHQFIVGFALETQNEEANARQKLTKKNLDMIVLNSLRDEGAGFGGDTNRIKIITKTDETDFPIKNKNEVAKDILDAIETRLSNNQANITF